MGKKILLILILCVFVSIIISASGSIINALNSTNVVNSLNKFNNLTSQEKQGTETASSKDTASIVHLKERSFEPSSITIAKGSSLTLVDDVSEQHNITNGTWKNGNAVPANEHGAPTVNMQFNESDSRTIGPFSVAGTYHLYCTYHPGMNLTVVVR